MKTPRMYTNILLYCCTLVLISLFTTCQKPDFKREAAVKTVSVTNITTETAVVVGNIIDLGEGLDEYGVFYSLSPNAQNGTKQVLGTPNGTGEFQVRLEHLAFGNGIIPDAMAMMAKTTCMEMKKRLAPKVKPKPILN